MSLTGLFLVAMRSRLELARAMRSKTEVSCSDMLHKYNQSVKFSNQEEASRVAETNDRERREYCIGVEGAHSDHDYPIILTNLLLQQDLPLFFKGVWHFLQTLASCVLAWRCHGLQPVSLYRLTVNPLFRIYCSCDAK